MDYDLFDRWRVRLRDVPSTIGWDAVALFLRHLPYGCATMREMAPSTVWSIEAHRLADLVDILGSALSDEYERMARPGETRPFETAEPVTDAELDAVLARFRRKGDGADG